MKAADYIESPERLSKGRPFANKKAGIPADPGPCPEVVQSLRVAATLEARFALNGFDGPAALAGVHPAVVRRTILEEE